MLFYLTMCSSSRLDFNKSTTDEQLDWIEIIHISTTSFHFREKKKTEQYALTYIVYWHDGKPIVKNVLLKLCLCYGILEMETTHLGVRKL